MSEEGIARVTVLASRSRDSLLGFWRLQESLAPSYTNIQQLMSAFELEITMTLAMVRLEREQVKEQVDGSGKHR